MTKGKNIAYVRVSTTDQNEARQNEALNKYNIDKWYVEKITGKDTNRPKLIEMLDFIREDDTVYVEEFSRLGRSTQDLLDIVQHIENKGAKFISIKENFDTKTPAGRLQMTDNCLLNALQLCNCFSLFSFPVYSHCFLRYGISENKTLNAL